MLVKSNPATNKFYLHEVADSEGNIVYQKNDGADSFKTVPKAQAELHGESTPSTDMVPQKTPDVKYDDMQPAQDYSSIISVMGKTLRSDALGKIASQGIESMDEFAGKIAEHYGETGNISPYTKYFSDDGKSVIEELKNLNSDGVSSLPKSKVVSFDENSGKIGHAMSLNGKSDEDVVFVRKGFDDEDLSAEEGVDNVSEREVNQNVNIEQTVSGRTDIHNENLGRTSDVGTGEYGGELSERTGETESQSRSGKEYEERRIRTQQLRESGKLIPGELKVEDKTYTFERIPADNISDDVEVLAIIRQNKARGLKTVLISGDIVGGKLRASGVHYGDTVYISYDNLEQSPTQINDHELVHFSSNSKAYASFKKSVFAKLTEKERTNLRQSFGKKYNEAVNEYLKKIHDALPDLPWNKVMELYNAYLEEEILANLNAGTLTLSVDVSEDIAIFRKAIGGYETSETETTSVDTESKANNSPADYKNEIDAGAKFNLVGVWPDGRKVYKTNYSKGTPKKVKQQDIIELVQNVWSKKPINLMIGNDQITVYFDPDLSERSDLSKIAFGNRKGTGSEKRITLDLASDLYAIAQDASYTGSKGELGKKNHPAHKDVKEWKYFATNLIYEDDAGERIPCYLNIDVKEKENGRFFYSFAIEKGTAPQTLLAVVSENNSPTAPKFNIPQNNGVVNNNSMQKSSDDAENTKYNSVSEKAEDVFKDSVVRDSNGNLKIMYRGGKENINVFDRKKSKPSNLYGRGFYFTDDKQTAERYGDVREYYLNIKNPLQHGDYNVTKEQMRKFLEAVAENEDDYDIWNYGTTDIDEILDNLYGKDDFWMIQDVSATAIGDLVEAIELFNEVNGTNYDGIMLETETVIFDSSQAKLADEVTYDDNGDEIPLSKRITESKDVRFNISDNKSYDYTKSFADQVDDLKKGDFPERDSLLVRDTPKIFKDIGFNALPMTVNQKHIKDAIFGTKDIEHSIGMALLKQLPVALENPVAVFKSQSHPTTSVVALLKLVHKGKNIIVPVEIDGFGFYNSIRIDSNAITTIFAKKNAITKQLNDAIKNETGGKTSIFFWNKKEALSLLQSVGLQLPKGLPQDGFIHSIREKSANINLKFDNVTETQQFKRWFGDWQKNPKRASKVVNNDGTPKILYHQTDNTFTVFDTIHKGAEDKRGRTFFVNFLCVNCSLNQN